jgi:hypothetical protein
MVHFIKLASTKYTETIGLKKDQLSLTNDKYIFMEFNLDFLFWFFF